MFFTLKTTAKSFVHGDLEKAPWKLRQGKYLDDTTMRLKYFAIAKLFEKVSIERLCKRPND